MKEKLKAFINAHVNQYRVVNDATLWNFVDEFNEDNVLVKDEYGDLVENLYKGLPSAVDAYLDGNKMSWMWESHLIQHDEDVDYVEDEEDYYSLFVLDEEKIVILVSECFYSTQVITKSGLGPEKCQDHFEFEALPFEKVLEFIE